MNQVALQGVKPKSQITGFGYADELFGFPRFPDSVREASHFPIRGDKSEFVPEIDESYVFLKEYLRILQFWVTGVEKNLLLQGPTGTGKTTLIEQVMARLGWPVYTIGCHKGVEFQELIGRVTLNPDGSTGWVDGPLIAAMRHGGVFNLDEMNFLDPGVAGGLNTVLQANGCLIPETGEYVFAHPDFRVSATGNAIDGNGKGAYRGVQTPNIALMTRFTLGARILYMSPENEVKMLMAKAGGIDPRIADYIAQIADMSRKAYEEGTMKAPMSPRETIATARRAVAYSGSHTGDEALSKQMENLHTCLEMTMLFRWSTEDRQAFSEAAKGVAKRTGLSINL